MLAHILLKLQQVGLLNENFDYSGKNKELEIIYIQPLNHNKENLVIDFNWIANWLDKRNKEDAFETELSKVLRIWAND